MDETMDEKVNDYSLAPAQAIAEPCNSMENRLSGDNDRGLELGLAMKPHWLFTAKTASEAGRKGALVKAARDAKARELEAQSEMLMNSAVVVMAMEPDQKYRLERLARTRKQLEMLDEKLERCKEPRDMKAIADAIARLCDVEQTLSGRPKPGVLRPVNPKQTRPNTSTGPVED